MQLNSMKKEIECPVCKKLPQDNDKYFPFCSSRCRLVDLGGWLDEKYRISEPTREEINPPACAVPGTADREKENVPGTG